MNNIFFYITPTIIRLVVVVLRLIGVYSVMEAKSPFLFPSWTLLIKPLSGSNEERHKVLILSELGH